MGKTNDERTSSNEFKQLLLPEEKRNFILCSSTSSSIKDSSNSSISISASPASTTSHLSEYSSPPDKATDARPKPIKKNSSAGNLSLSLSLNSSSSASEQTPPKPVNIKENKLNKENYALLLNDLENLKNYQRNQVHSSPSTKSSSINSLNQLIKPSTNSNNPPINRSLTFIGQNGTPVTADRPTIKQINHQYFQAPENDRIRLSKSASTQSPNLNALESSNLPQSYSAVFDDKRFDSRYDYRYDNPTGNQSNGYPNSQFTSYQNSQPSQSDSQSTKISFKDSFYRKWFLSKFKPDNELNFDQTKSKKPKLVNLKRYNSIDLYDNGAKRKADQEGRQPSRERSGEKENVLAAGPSGLQTSRKNSDTEAGQQLEIDHFKIQQLTNPLHHFYLNAEGCAHLDRWADASETFDNMPVLEDRNRVQTNAGSASYPTFAPTNYETEKKELVNDKRKPAQSPNEQQAKNNKKSILLPNLHNEYCTNANSSHHKHHENGGSTTSTTRSSSTNSSNISSSSSADSSEKAKAAGATLKPADNDLSGSLSSVSSDMNTDPMLPICKICHLNAKEDDPLITPCRCSGSVQFIHAKCLMRWLEISKKKSRKPLSCELCQYQYQWHKKFRVSIGKTCLLDSKEDRLNKSKLTLTKLSFFLNRLVIGNFPSARGEISCFTFYSVSQ